jgi:hypothetical protein
MKAARERLRQLAALKPEEMSAAEREEVIALICLQVDRDSLPPITAATRKSLKDVLEAFSDLDGAARVILGTSFVEKYQVEIKSRLASLKITHGHDIYYRHQGLVDNARTLAANREQGRQGRRRRL